MTEKRLFWPALVAGLASVLIPVVNADPVKKATDLTLYRPIEIPGMVLQPGNYVMKVPDWVTHPDMVGFYNEDESQLIKLVRTIPRYRVDPTAKTVITFEERAAGAPDAIKTWFFPGEVWGKEFVYGKAKALTIAEAPAPPAPAPAPVEEVAAAPLAPEPEAVIEEAPAEVAEATPPAAPEEVAVVPVEELPKTATSMPLAALIGGCALLLGLALRLRAVKEVG
jgi:LPXTG-motif cell wall-anchored protein